MAVRTRRSHARRRLPPRGLEFTFAPRRHIVRNEWLNLDIGFSAYQYRAHRDLDTGYSDPEKYEFYGLAVYPY